MSAVNWRHLATNWPYLHEPYLCTAYIFTSSHTVVHFVVLLRLVSEVYPHSKKKIYTAIALDLFPFEGGDQIVTATDSATRPMK